MEVTEVDYSGKRLHAGNLCGKCEEIKKSVAALKSNSSFKLNLSNNYLDDICIEALLSTLSDDRINEHHLGILELTNNRITRRGLFILAPLLIREDFEWLVAPANDFGLNDFQSLSSDLRILTYKESEETGIESDELLDKWLSKIIWVPKSFIANIDRLPIRPSSKVSHRKYYET